MRIVADMLFIHLHIWLSKMALWPLFLTLQGDI
jgi:hypothetical protein